MRQSHSSSSGFIEGVRTFGIFPPYAADGARRSPDPPQPTRDLACPRRTRLPDDPESGRPRLGGDARLCHRQRPPDRRARRPARDHALLLEGDCGWGRCRLLSHAGPSAANARRDAARPDARRALVRRPTARLALADDESADQQPAKRSLVQLYQRAADGEGERARS